MRHNLYKCMITLVISLIVMANVRSQTFTSSGAITINNGANVAASPYPSTINVSGLSGSITKVTVTVSGFNNPTPRDVDMLLVGPGGQSFIFCSDAGGTPDAVNLNITFDDAAATALPQSTFISTGTFRPTNYDVTEDVFPSPAPIGPYNNAPPFGAGTFALFNGTNPNGTWNLYVVEDDGDAANGSISSWSLTFTLGTPSNVLVTINQAEGQSDPASTGPINFTVIFSEAVTGFTSSDVTVGGTAGATTAVVTEIAPNNGTTYNVAVSGMTTSGTVIVGIPAGAAVNAANIFNTAATSTDNTVTYSAPVSVPPTVTINQAAGQSDPTSESPINFTVTFNQAVTGFTSSDISFTGSTPLIFILPDVTVTGGPSIYNVAVRGMRSSGTIVASVPAGVALNTTNQSNSGSTSTDNSVFYNIPPCTITCPSNMTVEATSLSGAVVNYTVTPAGDCQNIVRVPAPTTTFPVGTTTVNAYNNVSTGLVYGLIHTTDFFGTPIDQLVTFNVNTVSPTTLSTPITITGVVGQMRAIDFRPSNRQLYGLGVIWHASESPHYIGKIYTIDKNTGVATALSIEYFDLTDAISFDIDFNPVTEILRVTDAKGTNLRIDPDLGTVLASDPALSTGFIGAAYSNTFASSTFTSLYQINYLTDALYIQGGINGIPSSNTGATTLVGSLGIDISSQEFTGFDISLSSGALATFLVGGTSQLYSINLNSGAAFLIGSIGLLMDIAIAPVTLPAPSCSFTVNVTPPPPTVMINKAATQTDPTLSEPVLFTVVFSEPVTGFDASDISFTGSTVSGTLVANLTGSGTTYNVSVTGITSTGNVVASVPAGVVTNSSNVANLASTSTDNIVAVGVVTHDLMISKTATAPTVLAGGMINYLISLSYPNGPALPIVTITDILPQGTRYLSIEPVSSLPTPSPFIFTPNTGQNGTINIVFPVLSPGPPRTFLVRVGVESNVSGNLNNTASVSTYLGDINPSNNTSTASVQVIQPLSITCPANVSVSTGAANCVGAVDLGNLNYVITGPSPTLILSWRPNNNPAATLTSIVVVPGSSLPTNFPRGVTTVTATVSNGVAPNVSCQFTVTVVDNTPPQINCPGLQTFYVDANSCQITLPDYRNLATDNCGLLRVNQLAPSVLEPATYTVTLEAVDFSGNAISCQFPVTVLDTFPPTVTCKPDITVNAEPGQCYATATSVNLQSPLVSENCHIIRSKPPPLRSDGLSLTANYSAGVTTITWTESDVYGNTATCTQTVTVIDDQQPSISNVSVTPAILWPPNHQMKNVTVNYTSNDNCGVVTCRLEVSSNEPINGTGDGDTDPDWEIIDDHHVKLRAERAAHGDGRIYTITIICSDEQGNETRETVTVRVAHNITSPGSGQSFKIGSTVSFAGTFWDKPGNKHTAKWLIDNSTVANGIVTEPIGTKNGKVTGSYKFNTPGVYKLQMNITDQNGVTSYANTNGDLEAIVVIYDPNGGYTYGGGYYDSPGGALASNSSSEGKASYGFAMNYFKNSTNPKGETQFEFKVGDFEFNALNFDYLVISNSMAQFKGTGKIIGGQSGIGFTMTVTDGQLDGSGIDKIRMKIYNKNNGKIIYDNQPGASDAALPIQAVGANSIVVISGTNSSLTSANTNQKAEMEASVAEFSNDLDAIAYPNPSSSNFTINVKATTSKEKIMMQVIDMYGRLIETRNVNANSNIRFGDKYRPGTYFIRILQGKEHKELKLVKLSD